MNIAFTGIRSEEVITSSPTGKQCQGTVMIVRHKSGLAYPPLQDTIDALGDAELRDKFSTYPFFAQMTVAERRAYLVKNSVKKEVYLSDLPGIEVKFLALNFVVVAGKKTTPVFDAETVSMLMKGNPDHEEGFWPLDYVYQLFPRKVGSRAKRHTLVFRPGNWMLAPQEKKRETYQGLVCYLEKGKYLKTEITALEKGELLHVFEQLAVVTSQTQTTPLTLEELVDLAVSLTGESEQYGKIMQRLNPFAPSFLKSLLQKIIRFRPSTVEGLSANVYLLATFISLYTHGGAFVPDIQRFVSGKESALKRLAVSIMENSSVANFTPLHSLLAAALLARQGITYNPDRSLMKSWMKAALHALTSTQYYNYENHSNEVLEKCQGLSALLSAIGSFHTDISMASTIRSKSLANDLEGEEMSLAHAVDQHCYTDFAWFVDMRVKSYEELFKLTWQNVSCLNARKKQTIDHIFSSIITRAQTLFLESKEVTPIERKIVEGSYEFSITLDDAHLAALVGICEYKNSYAVLSPKNIYEFNAVKRPARGQETHYLTDEEYETAVENLKECLTEGYPVKHDLITKVMLEDEKYYVFDKQGKKHKWSKYKHQHFSFPLHEPVEKTLREAIFTCGNGVEQDADQFLGELFKFPHVIERALVYLEGCKKHIVPYKIGRDGKGTEYSVSVLDTAVYQFLAQLALLYPAALQHSPKSGFMVRHAYLFAHVVEMIKNHQKQSQEYGNWELAKEETRTLYDHQKMALQELRERNIIWMAPGMGKTAIVTSHIAKLIKEKKMPKYCVYTAPPSALETVLSEFEHRGIPTLVTTSGQIKSVLK